MKKSFTFLIATLMLMLTYFAWGQTRNDASITFSEQSYTNAQSLDSVSIEMDNNIVIRFDKNEGNTEPAYYNTGTAARLYGKNTLTVTPDNGCTITGMTLTFSTSSYVGTLSASAGDYSVDAATGTWAGSSSESIVITNTASSGHARIKTLSVTYISGGGQQTVVTPIFTPNAGNYYEPLDITINCATSDATIHYTLDGTEPTTESTVYNSPFTITRTTTVKAFAIKEGMNNSAVATAEYVINNEPTIIVEPAVIYASHERATDILPVNYENISLVVAEVRLCNEDGTEGATYDWINIMINDVDYDNYVEYTISENNNDTRTAYFKVIALDDDGNEVFSNIVTVTQNGPQNVTYDLVTDINDLTPGYHYLIASEITSGEVNIMDYQDNNNRKTKTVPVDEATNTISLKMTDTYYDFVISGDASNNYTIYDENPDSEGYLYANSNSSNQLKTRSENNTDDSKWSIEINPAGVASIVAHGDNSRNIMQYNSSSDLFSCYASSSQKDIYLYKKTIDNPAYYSPTEIIANNPNTNTEPIIVLNNEILTITGSFTGDDAANLIVEDGGQLIFNGDNVLATIRKSTAHAATTTINDVADWYTIASPLNENVTLENVANLVQGPTEEYDLYRYNETTMTWENSKTTGTGFTTLEAGNGYLYWSDSGAELEFAGVLRNADVSYTLKAESTGALKGFNLIGNPFSQNITMSNITNVSLPGGYVLTQDGSWKTYVEETIAPCQGFLVQVEETTEITISKNAAKSRENRDHIAFTISGNQYQDVAYALLKSSLGLRKISHRNSNIPIVYIPQEGNNYAIATMSNDTEMFGLNFKAMTPGNYTLSYKAEGKYDYIHILDRFTGEEIDMLRDGEYNFIASPCDNDARFIVKLSYNANGSSFGSNIFAYQNGNDIVISGEGELQVFDVTGRIIETLRIDGVQTINIPSTGVYIFKFNEKTQKIVIR